MADKVSRSEQKRQHKHIEAAARELAALGNQEIQRLPCSSELKKEIIAVRSVKGGARKRQIKYVAKLIKQENRAELFEFLKQEKGSKLEENSFHHLLERFRDAIVNEALQSYDLSRSSREQWEPEYSSSEIDLAVARFPEIDEQDLRRAAFQYAKTRNKVYYRELFRLLKAAAEKQKISGKVAQDMSDSQGETAA